MRTNKEYLMIFKNHLEGAGFKENTIKAYIRSINMFIDFILKKGTGSIIDIRENDFNDFHRILTNTITIFKKPYSPATVRMTLLCIKRFYRFLYRYEYILNNPVANCPSVKKGFENKKEIFTQDQMSIFLNSISTDNSCKERDRAFFELMYSSALRVTEQLNLNLTDIDMSQRLLTIHQGKGDKDRIIPFSKAALVFLKKYIDNSRKVFAKKIKSEDKKALFLSREGRVCNQTMRLSFKKYLKQAGIKRKRLTIHSVRHSTATHLLESGAGVRYVQELLGHESIETTVKYTHLMMENLKKAYKSAHPRENRYYDEVTDDYLENLKKLKEEIKRRKLINKRYPHYLYVKEKIDI